MYDSSYEKIVFIDVDLQDPPELIVEMYENSKVEICFFNPLILNFSSTNKIKLDEFLL